MSVPSPLTTTVGPSPTAKPKMTLNDVRRNGTALAIGSALWIPVLLGYGSGAPGGLQERAFNLAGLLFQGALLALLLTMTGTRATGDRLAGTLVLRIAQGLLAVAAVSTVLTTVFPSDTAPGWVLALDLFWPLSMLGLLVVGVVVAAVGRWRGPLRTWPLLCGAWLPVALAADGLLGQDTLAGMLVVGLWTAGTFPVLGLLLARRPHLTEVAR